MKTNPKIKEFLNELSKETVALKNTPSKQRAYVRKLKIFMDNNLSEEEIIHLYTTVLEELKFKNIVTDHDNIIAVHNIALRGFFLKGTMFILGSIIVVMIYNSGYNLHDVLEAILSVLKVFKI